MKRIFIASLLIASSLSPVMAETWTQASNITILRETGPISTFPEPKLSVKIEKDKVNVSLTDFFYNAGRFEAPWLSIEKRKMATLVIGTKSKGSWLFSTKEEHVRSIDIEISRKRLPTGTILYIYNQDTGEVMGHASIP